MHTVAEMVLPEWMGVTDMNAQEATETRELTFAELEDVAGGSPLLAVAAGPAFVRMIQCFVDDAVEMANGLLNPTLCD